MIKKLIPFLTAVFVFHVFVFGNLFVLLSSEGGVFVRVFVSYIGVLLFFGGMEWWLRKQIKRTSSNSDLVKIPIKLSFLLWMFAIIPCIGYLVMSGNNWGWFLIFFVPLGLGVLGLVYSVARILIGKIIKMVNPKLFDKGLSFVLARAIPFLIGLWVINIALVVLLFLQLFGMFG